MREGLRHVPVLLATRRRQLLVSERREHLFQGVADGLLLGEDAWRVAEVDSCAELASQAPQAREPAVDRAPAGDRV